MSETSELERETARLFRVWKTAHEMVRDRGYAISDDELNIDYEGFKVRFVGGDGNISRTQMNFRAAPTAAHIAKHGSTGVIYVEFNGDASVGVKHLRNFAHQISDQNFSVGIFISAAPVTSTALKIIPTVLPRVIEVFHEQDLLVNITKHELVPRHVVLSGEEKRALLDRYRVKESQLPRIQVGDPVARYLGLRRGQVVKIVRKSETAGRYASYRWCV